MAAARGAEVKNKTRQEKSKIKSMLIYFYDSKGIIHKEFVPTGQTVDAVFYVGVLKRMVSHIDELGQNTVKRKLAIVA